MSPAQAAPAAVPRRERARAATIEEIKATALDLMREQHTTDVRFTDIARVMGMTPPALYRYFADRDELLTALITDAYDDLGGPGRRLARRRCPTADIGGRWLAAARGLPLVGAPGARAVLADPRHAGARLRRRGGRPDDRGRQARHVPALGAVRRRRRSAASCTGR